MRSLAVGSFVFALLTHQPAGQSRGGRLGERLVAYFDSGK